MINRPKILYDGFCNLCSWSVQFVVRNDRKKMFDFVPLKSEEGINLLNEFNIDPGEYDSIILLAESGASVKSKAVLKIMKQLGGIWKAAAIFGILPDKLLDWIYDIIAKYRYKIFGRRNECFIPDSYFNNSQT